MEGEREKGGMRGGEDGEKCKQRRKFLTFFKCRLSNDVSYEKKANARKTRTSVCIT